jgi:general secretion pathway protein G
MHKQQKTSKGFTLIELLIVIAVISILIGILLPRFKGMQDEGNIAKAKGELRTLQTAVESYYIHNTNAFPAALTNLTSATPNIVNAIPDDPFASAGTTYVYTRGGTNNRYYILYSVGSAGNGSAAISATNTVTETNGSSCVYVSNIGQDAQP